MHSHLMHGCFRPHRSASQKAIQSVQPFFERSQNTPSVRCAAACHMGCMRCGLKTGQPNKNYSAKRYANGVDCCDVEYAQLDRDCLFSRCVQGCHVTAKPRPIKCAIETAVNTMICSRAGFKCVESLGRIIIRGWAAGRASGL